MWFRVLTVSVAAFAVVPTAPPPLEATLKPATLAAFQRYVQLTEGRITAELSGASPFLWINRQPASKRPALLSRLEQGEVINERLETRDGARAIDVDGGMIHHWIGTVLLPGVPLARARAFVQSYERYPNLFSPVVQRATVLERSANRFTVQIRTMMTKVVTVVIDADYRVDYRPMGPTRLHTRSVATNVFEVRNVGGTDEQRIPGDSGTGFLYRLNTYCSFEETAGGTIEQCESVSLTRDIPFGLGWLVGPFVNGIPRDTLAFTLGRVRSEAGRQ